MMAAFLPSAHISSISLPNWQPPRSSVKCQNVALWHSAPFGTWHFGTQLRLALGTLALSSVWHLALWHSAPFGTWHSGTRSQGALWRFGISVSRGSAWPAGFNQALRPCRL